MRAHHHRIALAAAAALALAGCAGLPGGQADGRAVDAGPSARSGAKPADAGARADALSAQPAAVLAALARGDAAAARSLAQQLVLADPRSAQAHLLLGAAHHLAGDPGSLDQALTGYGAARQLGGDGVWAPLLAGLAAMQRQQPGDALEHFAAAALADPDHALAFEGLAAAAYAEGRLALAEAAAQRAIGLRPSGQAASEPAWRLATLSAAAGGHAERTQALLRRPPAGLTVAHQTWIGERTRTLLRTARLDMPLAMAGASAAAKAAGDAASPAASTESATAASAAATAPPATAADKLSATLAANQITVDVTMILADDRRSKAYGVNLLDGLTSVFSAGRSASLVSANGALSSGNTTITRAISLPALNYNLNIFNHGNRYYEMLARPSLTAFQGQESTFFVGEQLALQVSGVNSAALEKLDVGVGLKINPSEIRADGATFKVEANRSFFSDQGIGSFTQGIATFKQSVSATADLRFGETLILSGLTESVTDGTGSRVPVLGDIPGPDLLFSRQTQLKRERSVLILVTPSRPLGLARGRVHTPALERLLGFWDSVLEPLAGLGALLQRIEHAPKFSRAAQADVQLPGLADSRLLGEVVAALGAGR